MKTWPYIIKTLLAVLFVSCVCTPGVYAAVDFPQLDIHGGPGSFSNDGTDPLITASVIGVILAEGGVNTPFDPFADFLLNADIANGDGNLLAGNVAAPLLTATFLNFTFIDMGAGSGSFFADLSYTGGSMAGDLTSGRIEGVFSPLALTAKIGPVTVVPIPAAIWLFGSGFIVLVSVARKRAGQ